MSKSTFGENNLVKFEANAVAFPAYGANLGVSLHENDPGEGGLFSTNPATYDTYAPITISRDNLGLTICNRSSPFAANPAGNAYKNAVQLTFPASSPGWVGPAQIRYVAIYDLVTGNILRRTAIGSPTPFVLLVGPNGTPFFPAGTLVWGED